MSRKSENFQPLEIPQSTPIQLGEDGELKEPFDSDGDPNSEIHFSTEELEKLQLEIENIVDEYVETVLPQMAKEDQKNFTYMKRGLAEVIFMYLIAPGIITFNIYKSVFEPIILAHDDVFMTLRNAPIHMRTEYIWVAVFLLFLETFYILYADKGAAWNAIADGTNPRSPELRKEEEEMSTKVILLGQMTEELPDHVFELKNPFPTKVEKNFVKKQLKNGKQRKKQKELDAVEQQKRATQLKMDLEERNRKSTEKQREEQLNTRFLQEKERLAAQALNKDLSEKKKN